MQHVVKNWLSWQKNIAEKYEKMSCNPLGWNYLDDTNVFFFAFAFYFYVHIFLNLFFKSVVDMTCTKKF